MLSTLILVVAAAHYVSETHCDRVSHILNTHHKEGMSHIIHQSWKNTVLPDNFEEWSATWRKQYPHWHYQLWTNEDNRQLVLEHYPWFLHTYDSLPTNISRADASRYMYMHKFGGIYADLDMEALRSMEDVLVGHKVFLANMGPEKAVFEHSVPNAWMAATPGHPLWLFCLEQIIHRTAYAKAKAEDKSDQPRWQEVEFITGPVLLYDSFMLYKATSKGKPEDVMVLPSRAVFPVDWRNARGDEDMPNAKDMDFSVCNFHDKSKFNPAACKRAFPDAYSITWWTHSWG